MNDYDKYELEELKAEDLYRKQYLKKLLNNPDCRDPDHPGCPACMEEDEEET